MSSPKEEKKIGEIIHFFGKINVGVVKLNSSLSVGDKIRIIGGDKDFDQRVDSMELDGEKIKKAKKGQSIGFKVEQKVRKGYKVYKL